MENDAKLAEDLRLFGVAFLMMTPNEVRRIPPEAVRIDMEKLRESLADSATEGRE